MTNSKDRQARVFISYSRKDGAFAGSLRDSLSASQFEAYLDKHDIAPGEPWRERLSGLISTADTVVFCLSPNFVVSPICDWEVNEAERLGKRLLPAVVADTPEADVPQRLKRLNYIFMRGESEAIEGLEKLVTALGTDIAWIRENTRLGERTLEWRARGLSEGVLLRGEQIAAAEAWLTGRPREAPEITDAIASFITESRKAETARARRARRRGQIITGASLTASAIMAFLGWQMYGQWQAAESRQSLNLANHANQQVAKGHTVVATLLALEALPDVRSTVFRDRLRPLVPDARVALYRAVHSGAGKWGLASHNKKVTAARLSPDAAFVATASADGTTRIWDAVTGRQHAVLVGHLGQINAIEFSPDGNQLATGSIDQTVRLWDWRNGRLQSIMVGHRAPVKRVVFDAAGKSLLSVAGGNEVHVWAVATGKLLLAPTEKSVTGSRIGFDRINFTTDGALLTVGGVLQTVARIWDVATGTSREIFKRAHDGGRRIDISPDGQRAVLVSREALRVLDLSTGGELSKLQPPTGASFWFTQFSADGSKLAAVVDIDEPGTKNARIAVIDAASGKVLCSTPHLDGFPHVFAFDGKGRRLFTLAGKQRKGFGPLVAWDGASCAPQASFSSQTNNIDPQTRLADVLTAIGGHIQPDNYAISPDGDRILSWHRSHVSVWDVSTGRQTAIHRVEGWKRSWERFVLHPSDRVIIGTDGKTLDVFDADSGRHLQRLDGHSHWYQEPLFSKDGSRLVTITQNAVILWETRSWTRVVPPIRDPRTIYRVSLSRDGHVLVQYEAGRDDPSFEDVMLDKRVAKIARVIASNDGREISLRPGDEERHLAELGSADGQHGFRPLPGSKSEIYKISSGRGVATLSGNIETISFSSSTRRVTTSRENDTWVWEFPSGKLVSRLTGNSGALGWNVSLSSDGRRLVTAPDLATPGAGNTTLGPDGRPIAATADKAKTLWLWNADMGRLIAPLEGHTREIRFQAMSSDGKRLITLAKDSTARVWSLATGRLEAVLDLGEARTSRAGAAFVSDGQNVLTWGDSGALIWSLAASTRAQAQRAQSNIPRCLTADERRAFFLTPAPPRWCYDLKKWPYHDHAKTPPPAHSAAERLMKGWDKLGGDAAVAALSRAMDWLRDRARRIVSGSQ